MDLEKPVEVKPPWIDRFPWSALVILAFWMAIAPLKPQPHLWEKLNMLALGQLSRPIDIFDLFLHSAPLALLGWKIQRYFGNLKR